MRRGCQAALATLLCALLVAALWLYLWLFYDLPSPEHLGRYFAQSSQASEYIAIPFAEMPTALRLAAVAVEDKQFYAPTDDMSLVAVARAVWFHLRDSGMGSDGHGISARLTANLMLASGKRVQHPVQQRLREMVLTASITRRYTRDQILELYLNSTNYGNGIHGVEAAAQYYFDKHARDLDLAECAMLQFISWQPNLNPLEDPKKAELGRAVVLDIMTIEGVISVEQASRAKEEKLVFVR